MHKSSKVYEEKHRRGKGKILCKCTGTKEKCNKMILIWKRKWKDIKRGYPALKNLIYKAIILWNTVITFKQEERE